MPRCCVAINDPKTKKRAVFVAVENDDEATGKALARDAAEEIYRKLHAEDPERLSRSPDVRVFTEREPGDE